MAQKVLKTYIPAISMCFTVIILMAGIINLVTEERQNFFIVFSFEVAGYLTLTCILDELIGRFDYKTYLGHFLTETVFLYPITMFFAVRFKWIGINTISIVLCSAVYFLVMAANHLYFYYMEKSNAEEINQLLEAWRDKNV
nr:hypothetical protein [uncultured Clostridium sp.]